MARPPAVRIVSGGRSPWRGRVVVWLGNVSFAFYLVHQLAIRWIHYAFGATRSFDTPEAIGLTALILVLAMAVATVLYYGVEQPMVRRFSVGRRARRSALSLVPETPVAALVTEPAVVETAMAEPSG
jgi:peptidoglycan/LPS O-acetylase OafA/YrhL